LSLNKVEYFIANAIYMDLIIISFDDPIIIAMHI